MSHYSLHLRFLAPIPVRNRVRLEYHLTRVGLFDEKTVNSPRVIDLETGIVWTSATNTRSAATLHATYFARVAYCEVETVPSDSSITTRLVLDPMEPPGERGPYR